ncbi:MAG TPA: tetratricopeptide repeat protein [Candidatus Limnocylindria bacterium]|nr:tetratricopeptide repeat protein [Candidatus Limnocylindria bacterium]
MDDRFEPYRNALKEGHSCALRGKYKDALRHYAEAAKLADDRAQPHVSSGAVLLRMGKAKDAVAAYERARQRAPEQPEVLAGLADALAAAGRRADADRLREQMAQLASQADEQRLEEAVQSGALPRGEMLHLAGYQARTGGRLDAAIEAWLDEARTYAEEGHLDAALDACQTALTVASGSARVHLEMARLYFRRGWRGLAVERLLLLDRLLDLAPEPDVGAEVLKLARQHARVDQRLADIVARPPV